MKKQILITFFLIISINKLMAEIPDSERLVLSNLAVSTDYANWYYFNWSGSIPVSAWNGIVVTNISGIDHVTEINLNSNNLNGVLNLDLDNLPYLTKLSFDNNNLSGSIPTTIGNLINLTYLNLGNNNLSGSIPSTFGNLINLEELILHENQLSNSIPSELGSCVELFNLDLDNNPLTGEIPNELSNLINMQLFYINNTLLSGNITNIYSSWPELAFFIMNDTLLTGDLDLSNNPSLYNFWATNCSLTSINIKNGENSTINAFSTINSPNLICIQVDNETNANNGDSPYTNWSKDITTSFSEDCNALNVNDYVLNNLILYPNPITNHLFINNEINSFTEIEIYNIIGKKIFSSTIESGINKIDFSNIKTGVYIIKSKNRDNNYVINKIIKK